MSEAFHAGREGRRTVATIPLPLRLLWVSLPLVCGCLSPQHAAAQGAPDTGQPPAGGTTVNLGTIPVTAPAPNGPTIGQAPDAEGIRDYVVTRNRTGGKADLPNADVAQHVTVVPEKLIIDQADQNLTTATRNVAGVSQSAFASYSAVDGYQLIRGFPVGTFLKNGLYQPYVGTQSPDPWLGNVERVEVLKGPAALLYGPTVAFGGVGGIINVLTKLPLRERAYTIGAQYSTYRDRDVHVDISQPLNANGSWLGRFEGRIGEDPTWIENGGQKHRDGSLTLQGQIDPNTTVTLIAEKLYLRSQAYYGIPAYGTIFPPFRQFRRNQNIQDPNFYSTSDTARAQLILEHRFNDSWSIRSSVDLSRFNYRSRGGAFINPLANGTFSAIYQANDVSNLDTFNTDNSVNGKFTTFGHAHNLVAGFQYTNQAGDVDLLRGTFARATATDPTTLWRQTPINVQLSQLYKTENSRYAVYANDVVNLSDRLKLSAGVSYIGATSDQIDKLTGNREVFNRTDDGVAFRVGPIYELAPGVAVWADYATTFIPQTPSLTSRGYSYFNPVTGDQVEGGIKVDLASRISLTASAYQLTEQNVVTQDQANPLFSVQTGEQRSRGIELDATYKLAPGWDLLTAYAYTDAQITKDNTFLVGSRIANVPRHALRLWSTYEITDGPLSGLGFGGGLYGATQRPGNLPPRSAPLVASLREYWTVDAAVYYRRAGWRLSANVINMLNRDYYESGQGLGRLYPGQPATVLFRVDKTF